MNIYSYEEAFGAADKTSRAMRRAIGQWYDLYYRQGCFDGDPCQRIAYTVVGKLIKTAFGEYLAQGDTKFARQIVTSMDARRLETMQQLLIGGECFLKPCPEKKGFTFVTVPRNRVLVFGRDYGGRPTDVGFLRRSTQGKHYYTLLERRRTDGRCLTIESTLYQSLSPDTLGNKVPLTYCPEYAALQEKLVLPLGNLGLVHLKMPMVNCVDGSCDGVSVYAAAVGLIENIDRNEKLLREEFERGQSRILTSADLLRQDEDGRRVFDETLFVGLDDDVEHTGIHIFSPSLREQSFLRRKQEYLRNVESVIGLKRGMLSDANADQRTATEISSSAGDFNLTVIDIQQVWAKALEEALSLCTALGEIYRIPGTGKISVDWGNGILYDESQTWQEYIQMVSSGLIKPEIALGWRFNMPTDTREQLDAIRQKYMPEK